MLCIKSPDKLLAENKVKKAVKKINDKVIVVVYKEKKRQIPSYYGIRYF